MDIEQIKAKQISLGALGTHVVELREDGWVIAHTQDERDLGPEAMAGCDLVIALREADGPPEEPGLYYADPHVPDAYSEAYRPGSIGWDFHPVAEDGS